MKVIRFPTVHEMIGVSKVTLWRWERDGKFPKRVRLGCGSVGWIEKEVADWLATRPRGMIPSHTK